MDKVSRGTGTLQNGSAEDAASVSSGSSKKAARELWKGRISKLDTTQKLDVIGICIYWAVRRVPLPKTGGDGILHYPFPGPRG